MSHLGGAYVSDGNTFMPDVWGYLLVKYKIKRVLDVGCGYGQAVKWFSDLGVEARGVEGYEDCIQKSPVAGRIDKHDFTTGPYVNGSPFDMAWCSEVLEHIEEQYLDNLAPCFQCSRISVITHAEPMQAGTHHVNCQTDSYWINVFCGWGLQYDDDETQLLRLTDKWGAAWGRRSLMVFKQK